MPEFVGWARNGCPPADNHWRVFCKGDAEDHVRDTLIRLTAKRAHQVKGSICSRVVLRESQGRPDGPATITDAEIRGAEL